MDLAAVERAAKVIPVFVRNDDEVNQNPLNLNKGCFDCEHARPMGTRSAYNTVVLYREDDNGTDFSEPVLGFVVSTSDSSYQDLTRYHWMRYLISGASGFYGGWTSWAALQDYETLFVRLFNAFDGKGVQHKHARVNLFEYVEEFEGQELFASVFEAHAGRIGLYVDPVEEIRNARTWEIDDVNKFVHTPYRGSRDQQRIVNYYWNGLKHNRLKQLKAGDTMPDVEPDGNDRMAAINAIVRDAERTREATLRREQQRLINANNGRTPRVQVQYDDDNGNAPRWLTNAGFNERNANAALLDGPEEF